MNTFSHWIGLSLLLLVQLSLSASLASPQSQKELQHANNLLHNNQAQFALRHLDSALNLDPGDLDSRLRRADVLLELDEAQKALADLSIVIKNRPNDTFAYKLRSQAMFVLRKYDQAVTDISKSLQLANDDPSKVDRYYQRADLYRFLNKPDLALKDINAVSAIKKKLDTNFYYHRGGAYFALGEYKKSVADYTSSIEHMDKDDRERGRYYGLRANAYEKMGRHDLAEADRKRTNDLAKENYYSP
jgi:tetratricopeptide (TPR) repeat protein